MSRAVQPPETPGRFTSNLGWENVPKAAAAPYGPYMDDGVPSFALALEEARRGFDGLNDEFARVRARAASTLSIGGLSATFLGGLALRDKEAALSLWTGLAVVAFVALAATNVYVLWPRMMYSAIDPEKLIGWALGDADGGTARMKEGWQTMYLARAIGEGYNRNLPRVRLLGKAYTWGIAALTLEISFLIADLATR